ncbi:MAG TPA: GNAT family N-acetyltransferase [Verrucomicrobiae bacterium]|jgi:GNAT superfamily N-acetyltransferase
MKAATAPKLIVRPARKSDGKSFISLIVALADYEKLAPPTLAARKRLLKDAFGKRPKFKSLLALIDGVPVGYAIYFYTYSSFLARPTLFLEDVFVLPDYRKRKAGAALFHACVAEAKKKGCGRMEWMVLDWNKLAIGFYDKLGGKQLSDWLPYRLTSDQFDGTIRTTSLSIARKTTR